MVKKDVSRDSLQSAKKNQVLKLNIDKVTVISVHANNPFERPSPVVSWYVYTVLYNLMSAHAQSPTGAVAAVARVRARSATNPTPHCLKHNHAPAATAAASCKCVHTTDRICAAGASGARHIFGPKVCCVRPQRPAAKVGCRAAGTGSWRDPRSRDRPLRVGLGLQKQAVNSDAIPRCWAGGPR